MIRALCPFCELPRAMVSIICGYIPMVSCECVPRGAFWSMAGGCMRAIPMTENHDPGDEDATP